MFVLRTCICWICVLQVAAASRQHILLKGLGTKVGHSPSEQWMGCSRGLHYRFVRYEASEWEAAAWKESACEQVASGAAEVSAWLAGVQDFRANQTQVALTNDAGMAPRNEATFSSFDKAIFSRMIYKNACPGESTSKYLSVPVEPLIGHLRHPFAVCSKDQQTKVHIEDKSYLLINAWPSRIILANFPGRKYLFDMGSSTFDTSLTFFEKHYGQAGVIFDEIWAWEMRPYDPTEYWAKVPDEYKGRIHFYNTAFNADINNASHPLNIMRSLYRPGDMFVMKLDIDNAPLELSVIDAIESDPALFHMIAEMFFEMHYDHHDMAGAFGLDNGRTLADVMQRFVALRKAGLYLHFWP